jgi:gliding motility-associated-like protein
VSTALNGCTKSDVVSITITPLPNVNAGLDASICEGESYTFNATSNATTYSWAPNTSLDDGSVLNPTATPTSTTNYTVTATDGVGCSATDDLNVTVLPLPVTTVTPNQDICDGDDVTLSASGADSYIWDNGLGAGSTHLVTPSIGVTTYTVVSTAINGCTVNDVVNINVNALPTVNAGPDISVCENEGVLFNATGANTYIWSSGANNGETVNYGPGNYNFTVTGADANGCENTDDFSFVVNSIPDLIVSDNQSFCKDDVVNLFVSGADTYDWDNGQSTGDNYQIQPTSSLNVTVKGIANGCEAEKIIELYYEDPGLISAGEDAFVCKGFSIDLSATGGQNYSWEGPNIENGNNQNVNVLVEESAYYYVTVMTEHCEYKDSVFIDLKTDPSCGIDYGNTISPNGDGVNDEWIIDGIDAFPNNRVVVYNRWGDIVFEGDNYDNTNIKWEGTQIDGSEAIPGTYFYQIDLITGPSYSGWIELIR